MKHKLWIILPIIIFVLLSSCQAGSTATSLPPTTNPVNSQPVQSGNIPTLEPYVFKTSEPETVTISGYLMVFDPSVSVPDPNDAIFLVPMPVGDEGVVTIPPFKVGEVPQAEVDERTGDFVFTNIQPGRYAIVVLTVGGAQVPARFVKNGNLAILEFKESDRGQAIKLDYLGL